MRFGPFFRPTPLPASRGARTENGEKDGLKPAPPAVANLAAALFALGLSAAVPTFAQPGGIFDSPGLAPPPERAVVFFPPLPPPLDLEVPPEHLVAVHPSPPAELAEFVGDVFYPQLGSRLHDSKLDSRLRQQLENYRANKAALLQSLRLELARLRPAAPAERRQAFQALARRQERALAALEAAAESLRRDLGMRTRSWSRHREWRLGQPEKRGFSPAEISQVMRDYAFYDDALVAGQRSLLREIAHELLLAAQNTTAAALAQRHVFFSPSPARIRWPDRAPPEAVEKFAAYQTQKARLKKELYDAVAQHDRGGLRFGNPLAEIAQQHAPRLERLEAMAEDIRVALAPFPAAIGETPRSFLPPPLPGEAAALQQRRRALQRDATLKLEAVAVSVRDRLPVHITFKFETDGMKFVIVPHARPSAELSAGVQALGTEISAIADEYGRGLVEVTNAEEEIRRKIGELVRTRNPQTIEAEFQNAIRSADAARLAAGFEEYRVAVFEPGLSSAQRRLLFDAALLQLELDLPRGELQAWRRADTW